MPSRSASSAKVGVKRNCKTSKNVKGARVKGQKVIVEDGKIAEYRVNLDVTFILK